MRRAVAFYQHDNFVYLVAITLSLILSLWISARETVINPDAICYLLSAQEIGANGLGKAMHICAQSKWPFYSILIYGFVLLTHFAYTLSAFILDAFFSVISVVTFIAIVKELGGTRRVLWLAALVILSVHEFNTVRQYIIRDHGFWAFYLTSFLLLLHYFREPKWITALGWSASLLLATLFRIEGAIFLFTMPFLAFFSARTGFRQRVKSFVSLNIVTIVICAALAVWVLSHQQQSLDRLGRVTELLTQAQNGFSLIVEQYNHTKAALLEHVLSSDSARDAGLILFLMLIITYCINVVGNLSLGFSLIVAYVCCSKAVTFARSAVVVMTGYLVVNVAITIGFYAEHLFLSRRYLIALSLILMLLVPFGLEMLIRQWNSKWHRIFLSFVAVLMLISTLGGIFDFGYSKTYIRDAGDWLARNIPADAKLYANDYQLMYYSQHFGSQIFQKLDDYRDSGAIAHDKWKQYDYLALRVGSKETVFREISQSPILVFKNKRGDRVNIYKIVH